MFELSDQAKKRSRHADALWTKLRAKPHKTRYIVRQIQLADPFSRPVMFRFKRMASRCRARQMIPNYHAHCTLQHARIGLMMTSPNRGLRRSAIGRTVSFHDI